MKKVLLTLVLLFACMDGFAQLRLEDGIVYCDQDYLVIGKIQANFIDDMAVCQYPSGYAFMLLEGDKPLVTVALGEDKEQAMTGMQDLIELAMKKVSVREMVMLKNIEGEDVQMILYPEDKSGLKTKARLFCPSQNMGSGIVLVNNLHYFNKVLAKYPGVQFTTLEEIPSQE